MNQSDRDIIYDMLNRFAINYSVASNDNERARTDNAVREFIEGATKYNALIEELKDHYESVKGVKNEVIHK